MNFVLMYCMLVLWLPGKSRKFEEKDAEMQLAQEKLKILERDSEIKAEKVRRLLKIVPEQIRRQIVLETYVVLGTLLFMDVY